jgi:hypothetical protein
MKTRALLFATFLVVYACAAQITYEPAIQSAGDEARSLATDYFAGFELVAERGVPAGGEFSSTKIKLKEGACYRFLAVRAESDEAETIKLDFSHSDVIVETESDFIELSKKDGALRSQRVVWGTCVWPTLVGELTIYDNLSETGGYILVLKAEASTLSWKAGRDVRMYMAAKGLVDLDGLEQQEAEPKLQEAYAEHHKMLPPILYESYPSYSEVLSTVQTGWKRHFIMKPKTCYHLFVNSLNCRTEYELSNTKTGDVIHDDGAPWGVGRLGWSHDFCPEKKDYDKDAVLKVKFTMDSDEYDKCWFTVAMYEYQADHKEKKQLKAEVAEERTLAQSHVDECAAERLVCESTCGDEEHACMSTCSAEFVACADTILFEGQQP